ncbi:hypothetical protein BKG02_004756 [Vibrio parahaemolyticus]|uniref:TrfB-related DNA-binding protein n=1 Tax=Vibrio parahaemolyticus TaxID=670 RepID=UPI0028083C8B|nr:TrfB-related DNA-binding protein [Vibrio parahaemolyticus]EJE4644403.1 hypothetical protein [Vibrio parahaemolyticus]ELA9292947.1 hypothetical protein [Vibrio parahaemolyticus]MDS1925688.1 TrfB-related DNA-binding protein [Vibrio parahaemolyticus]HCG8016796.1 hypothetical protein [Vibrio parahaemolyticus]
MQNTITQSDFDALKPELGRLTLRSIEVAEQVLVKGRDQVDVAREYKLSRQRVNDIIARVQAAADAVPAGWVRVEAWFPPELAEQVKQMQAEALAAASKDTE